MNINENLFVITGGPGVGKTTLLHELERRGCAVVPELARQIIQEQVQTKGNALPWADMKSYTHLMLSRSVESFLSLNQASFPTLCDRGIPDALCYARIINLPDVRELESACARFRYNRQVFVLPPWKEIYKTDTERKQSFDEAVRVYEEMVRVYEVCGYEIREVPQREVQLRAEFILDCIRPG
jgi:predicted ATPase